MEFEDKILLSNLAIDFEKSLHFIYAFVQIYGH